MLAEDRCAKRALIPSTLFSSRDAQRVDDHVAYMTVPRPSGAHAGRSHARFLLRRVSRERGFDNLLRSQFPDGRRTPQPAPGVVQRDCLK